MSTDIATDIAIDNKPPYLPFADGKWRMVLGLKALDLADWIELDPHAPRYLARKQELLNSRHGDVVGGLPDSVAAQQEVLDLLLAHLPTRFPQHYHWQGDRFYNQLTGESWLPSDFATQPIDLAGRLVQDDLCLMMPSPEGYRLAAASLCFPLHWRLRDKLGLPIAQIHAPVPGYTPALERPVDSFFERLRPDCPGYRLNWSIVDTPELFLGDFGHSQERPAVAESLTPAEVGDRLWLRVERQTLRRLPQSNGVLFGIHTYINPLRSLADYPDIAAGLAEAIAQIPADMQQYKNLLPVRDPVLQYLNRVLEPCCHPNGITDRPRTGGGHDRSADLGD